MFLAFVSLGQDKENDKMKICLNVFLLLCFFIQGSLLQAQVGFQHAVTSPTMEVQGTAVLKVPADEVGIVLGVETSAPSVKVAVSQNNKLIDEVIKSISALGIGKDDYETDTFTVNVNYSTAKFNNPRTIDGYTVNNSISVKTDKLALASDIIGVATQVGANRVNSVTFGLKDYRNSREEAISQATDNAKKDAAILAKSSGLVLKRILSVSVGDAYQGVLSHQPVVGFFNHKVSENFSSPPIHAGDVSVRATVRIVYEIE